MKISTRSLQQTLLLCIGLCFLAPTVWVHHRMDHACHDDDTDNEMMQRAASNAVGPLSVSSRKVLLQNSQSSPATARRDGAVSSSRRTASDNDDSSSKSKSICGDLLSTRSAFSLWMDHINQIHQHSRLIQDKQGYRLHDLTVQVLQLFTPQLPLSVRTVTRNPAHLEALFDKTKRRYDYLVEQQQQQSAAQTQTGRRAASTQSPPAPPVVKIVVLGGSVTAGVNCISGVGNANLGACAWPARLETLVNGMVHDIVMIAANTTAKQQQQPLVEVHVFAIGGSNTKTATTLLEYDLLPQQAKNPDIIINAFSTNDMHVDTVKMATSQEKKLPDLVFDMMQDFVRVVLRPPRRNQRGCPLSSSSAQMQQYPPVLLWLDDYLGNEQRLIMETTAVSKAMHLLSNYYGFASVSYADAVRDVVYGDTHEQLFSPNWYKGGKKKKQGGGGGDGFLREIHPGQGMHMATAWTVAYNLLHLATHYCSLQQAPVQENEPPTATDDTDNFVPWPGLPSLRKTKQIGGSIAAVKPGPTPDTLPPPLTDTLNLRRVSVDWQESHQAYQQEANADFENTNNQHDHACRNNDEEYKQCPFSWIVGLPVDGRNVDLFHERESNAENDMREIHDYFVQHATVSDLGGWQVQDDTKRKKYGWVPPASTTEPTMMLEFWKMTQPIRTITLFILRSYGEKWANSSVRVSVSTAATRELGKKKSDNNNKDHWKMAASKELVGFHDKHTSEMYTEPIVLPHVVQPGQAIRIAITLIGGTTFKIQGMAVCS